MKPAKQHTLPASPAKRVHGKRRRGGASGLCERGTAATDANGAARARRVRHADLNEMRIAQEFSRSDLYRDHARALSYGSTCRWRGVPAQGAHDFARPRAQRGASRRFAVTCSLTKSAARKTKHTRKEMKRHIMQTGEDSLPAMSAPTCTACKVSVFTRQARAVARVGRRARRQRAQRRAQDVRILHAVHARLAAPPSTSSCHLLLRLRCSLRRWSKPPRCFASSTSRCV